MEIFKEPIIQKKRRKNTDADFCNQKVILEKTLEENKQLKIQKFEKDKVYLDSWLENIKKKENELKLHSGSRLEKNKLRHEIENERLLYDLEKKKLDPSILINLIDQILDFLGSLKCIEDCNNTDTQMQTVFQKALKYIKKSKKEQFEAVSTSLMKHKRKRSNPKKTDAKKTQNVASSGFNLFEMQESDNTSMIPKEIGSYMLALCLGEIKMQDLITECPTCIGPDEKYIVMEYVEKPEPRFVCPQCGVYSIIAEVYFETNREKETPDSNGWGNIGNKSSFPDMLRKFIDHDIRYLDKIPIDIKDEIYLLLAENGKTDLEKLKWEHVDSLLKKLNDKHNKDAIYQEITANSWSIFLSIRGAPVIVFTDEEIVKIYDTYQKFVNLWNEEEKTERAVSTMIAWLFTLLACGYPKETVMEFHPSRNFESFQDDDPTFMKISKRMGINPPITFAQLSPRFAPVLVNNQSSDVFAASRLENITVIEKNIPDKKTNSEAKIKKHKKSSFTILD